LPLFSNSIVNPRQCFRRALRDRGGAARLALAHIPRRERDETAARILAGARLAHARDREDDRNVLFLVLEEVALHFGDRRQGARLCRTRRQCELQLGTPLVFHRQKAGRQREEHDDQDRHAG
jgi:hypothetical protein